MMFLTLGEWLNRRAQLMPEKIGLIDGQTGNRFSYRTLYLRAYALAAYLAQYYNIQPGQRIAILALNSPEYLDLLFASALLGAILVPLNWRLTERELLSLLADCQPQLLIYDESHRIKATEVADQYSGLALLATAAFPGADVGLARRCEPVQSPDGEEIALILYTSGTTGRPKGAMLSHRMLTWNAINTQISWGLREDDITLTFAPFFHAGGLNVLTTPLYHLGGTVVLAPNAEPGTLLELVERERCTLLFAVPTVFERISEHAAFATTDFSALRFCVTGGSPCPREIIERYARSGLQMRQGYGLTEVGVNCFSLAPEDALSRPGSVGKPIFHSYARVIEAGVDVAPGEVGELALAGPHLCSGYWQQPEATREAYQDGWWYTGDLVRADSDGYYSIVGRKKDMFISGGENIYPAEIERVIQGHPDVLEVAVIPQPDPQWGESGLALVVLHSPGILASTDILAHCTGQLARYKIPKTVRFVEAL
ncbi:MAG TPA: AMP-binding protein, partial [Ktedonobacteraceae bacterium]|nr:AMP-binding protein [Ktedonobacteraceae bacterium]